MEYGMRVDDNSGARLRGVVLGDKGRRGRGAGRSGNGLRGLDLGGLVEGGGKSLGYVEERSANMEGVRSEGDDGNGGRDWDYCGWYDYDGGEDVEGFEDDGDVGMMGGYEGLGNDAKMLEGEEYEREKSLNFEVIQDLSMREEKRFWGVSDDESVYSNREGVVVVGGRGAGGGEDGRGVRVGVGRGYGQDGEDGRDLDITWAEAAEGVDIQGIPWDGLPFSRADYRATRLRDGRQVEANGLNNGLGPIIERKPRVKDIKEDVERDGSYYCFYKNTRRVKSSIVHFQLRNLVWATSRHDVYVMDENDVYHWDAAACRKRLELSLSGNGVEDGTRVADKVAPLGHVQISTMIATDDWLIAGGFYGEVVAKNLKTNTVMYNKRITVDENAITNAVDIFDNKIMVSNNDRYVRVYDGNTFAVLSQRQYPCAINHATKQPNGNLVAIVGDDCQAFVVDDLSGDKVATLNGHIDFSFATAWHPDGVLFATGSQDDTCRVWDRRNMSESVVTLGGHMGAMRSVRFSSCGRFLAMAEPRDFVHIYDISRGNFNECQEIDIFGEIAGMSFSPDGDSMFLGVWDRSYGSLLEFERKVSHKPYGPNSYM